jgi:bleomycin hydrolase
MHHFLFLATFFSLYSALEASTLERIDPDELHATCEEIEQTPHFRMMRNVLTQNFNYPIAQNWDAVRSMDFLFSDEISSSFNPSNQKGSGRCWIYAALNMLRCELNKKMAISDFEFSASHLFFYDKVEKANIFLERIIQNWSEPLDSQFIRFLLCHSIDDGGDWSVFVDLVNKYGLVPASVYPENASCHFSPPLNKVLRLKLTKDAHLLRELLAKGATIDYAREVKKELLKQVYQILVVHMGAPPVTFDYSFYDKEKTLYQFKKLTPLSFAAECIDYPLNEYAVLIHSPRNDTPYYTNYLISNSGYMVGGTDRIGLNIPIEELKKITKEMLLADHAVCFSADIASQSDRFTGLLDANLYEFDYIYQTDFSMTKSSRLKYLLSVPNHALLFTGVHLEDDIPIRWKVENSWGTDIGKNGFFVMNDNWFDEYVFGIIVPKNKLPEELQKLLSNPPTTLAPWDPLWSNSD